MKIYLFNFHGDNTKSEIFGSFAYEHTTMIEKRSGELIMAGEVLDGSSHDRKIFFELSQRIKDKFYGSEFKNPEKALNASLQNANIFLERTSDQTSGFFTQRLNFAAIAVKGRDWHFSKIGDIAIYILRQSRAMNINEIIQNSNFNGDKSLAFGSIASGTLNYGDSIMVVTNDLEAALKRLRIDQKIAGFAAAENIDNPCQIRDIEELLLANKGELINARGVCVIASLRSPDEAPYMRDFAPSEHVKKFFLREAIKASVSGRDNRSKRLLFPGQKIRRIKKIIAISVSLIILLLISTFAFFFWRESVKAAQIDKIIIEAQSQVEIASNLVSAQENEKAADILDSDIISKLNYLPLESILDPKKRNQSSLLRTKVNRLRDQIEKIEYHAASTIFNLGNIKAESMVNANNGYYLFNLPTEKIFYLNESKEMVELKAPIIFDKIAQCGNELVLFSKSGKIVTLKKTNFSGITSLKLAPINFSESQFYCYKKNLYFLENSSGTIIKYPNDGGNYWGAPEVWLNSDSSRVIGAVSAYFDKSLWVLGNDGGISRYYAGKLQDANKFNWQPALGLKAKIIYSPASDSIFVSNPDYDLIALVDNAGQMVKKIKNSEITKFNDFTVSQDGKKIFILDDDKLLELQISI